MKVREERDRFYSQILAAIQGADEIADAAVLGEYVQPRILLWKEAFMYGPSGMGYFGDFDQRLRQALSGAGVTLPSREPISGHFTGSAAGSEAVYRGIEKLHQVGSKWRTYVAFGGMDLALHLASADEAQNHYDFFSMLLDNLELLADTMLTNMEQGDRPKPTPKPGQIVVSTPFGDDVIDAPEKKIGDMSKAEFAEFIIPLIRGGR